MTTMTDHVISLQERVEKIECGCCNGSGQVEYEVERPHAGGFNEGYIDTEWGECEECGGTGEVAPLCPACGEEMTVWDTMHGIVCQACQEEE